MLSTNPDLCILASNIATGRKTTLHHKRVCKAPQAVRNSALHLAWQPAEYQAKYDHLRTSNCTHLPKYTHCTTAAMRPQAMTLTTPLELLTAPSPTTPTKRDSLPQR